ncbi:GAF domain-containing protein [Nisaea sp.]|uniref:GAF domain-containing protein n=1 Tax=Nisaea sp. TaxID=2024842 RepID=UPI003B52361F
MSIAATELFRNEELRRLRVLDTPHEEEFDLVVQLAAHLFNAPIALVSLVDETRQWFKAHYGLETRETDRKHAFCTHAIKGDEVMVVPDAQADERFRDNPLVTGDPSIRFYAGAPLLSRNAARLGTLCVIDRVPREFSDYERRLLKALSFIVNARLENRLAGRYDFGPEKNHARFIAALGEVTAGFVDELSNATSIALGNLDFLERTAGSDATSLGRINTIRRQCGRSMRLATDLDRLARGYRSDLPPLELRSVLRNARPRLSARLPASIPLLIHAAEQSSHVSAREDELVKGLCTMVSLAGAHAKPRGKVELAQERIAADKLPFGEGDHPAKPVDFFTRIRASSNAGAQESASVPPERLLQDEAEGLSLAFAHLVAFAGECGGHVDFGGTGESGFAIDLYLPRADVPEYLMREEPRPLSSLSAIVAEADSRRRQRLVILLESLGINVLEAADAEAVRTHLDEQHVDLLLVAPRLPHRTSGLHLVGELLPSFSALRFIFVYPESATGFESLANEFQRCGAAPDTAGTSDLATVIRSLF